MPDNAVIQAVATALTAAALTVVLTWRLRIRAWQTRAVAVTGGALASLVAPVVIPAATALLAGGALAELATRLRIGPLRTWTAAVAGGALGALIAAELVFGNTGNWWQAHPMTGATVTGVLLLALTVLVVEAAIERALNAAEERRWEHAGRVACESIIDAVAAPIGDFKRTVLWPTTEHLARGDPGETVSVEPGALDRVVRLDQTMRDAVLRAAPVLTSTDRLHDIYASALQVLPAAAGLAAGFERWAREVAEGPVMSLEPGTTLSRGAARMGWWLNVLPAWDRLRATLDDFSEVAERAFDISALGKHGPFWRMDAAEYERVRRNFRPPELEGWE